MAAMPQREFSEEETTESKTEFDPSNIFQSYVNTWKNIVVDPRGFFSRMPTKAGYTNPIIFLIINSAIGGLLGGLVAAGIAAGLVAIPAGIITAIIGSFIGGAILHLFAYLLADKAIGGFEATWRVIAYTSALLVLTWIPFLGALVGLYGIYIEVVGIEQAHKTTTAKALAAVLAPIIIFIVFLTIVMLTIGFALLLPNF